jgi:putative membrane protein
VPRHFKQQQRGEVRYSSLQLRIINEIATVLLFAIVFLVVLKNTLSMVWGLVGLAVFIVVLLGAIRTYKRLREKKEPRKK